MPTGRDRTHPITVVCKNDSGGRNVAAKPAHDRQAGRRKGAVRADRFRIPFSAFHSGAACDPFNQCANVDRSRREFRRAARRGVQIPPPQPTTVAPHSNCPAPPSPVSTLTAGSPRGYRSDGVGRRPCKSGQRSRADETCMELRGSRCALGKPLFRRPGETCRRRRMRASSAGRVGKCRRIEQNRRA